MSEIAIIGQLSALAWDHTRITYLADGVEYCADISAELVEDNGGLAEALSSKIERDGHDHELTARVKAERLSFAQSVYGKSICVSFGSLRPVINGGTGATPVEEFRKFLNGEAHTAMMDEITADHTIPENSGRALTLEMDNKPLKRIDKIAKY